MVQDVTARKQAEADLLIFRMFAEAAGQGFGFAKLDGDITYGNQALCRLLGERSLEDLQGKNVVLYYDEQDKKELAEVILPMVLKEGQWIGEMPLKSIQGRLTPVIQNISLIRTPEGAPLFFANVITDITGRKQAEEVLKKSEERLKLVLEGSQQGFWDWNLETGEVIRFSI
jgi:PAS domain S-box-containing protein